MNSTSRRRPTQNEDSPLNVPGILYLNADIVDEVRQLSGAGGRGTVDELGFQLLYDRIAERLFPWCSTLTSRARYFFFSLSVLDIALREVVEDSLLDPNRDDAQLAALIEQKRRPLARAIRRIERALALSLVAKHQSTENGIFGSLRCRRWLKEEAPVSGRGKILSSDARYPNAIYRGASRALQMFAAEDSTTTGLLRARLRGDAIFDIEWHAHAKTALPVLRDLDEFWQSKSKSTFSKAASALEEFSAFKVFTGFVLSKDEARFLYERIQRATPYYGPIALTRLPALVEGPELDLGKVKELVADKSDRELFEAARHIDAVTTPFRSLYQKCSEDRTAAMKAAIPTAQIRDAKAWLDAASRASGLQWAPVWKSDIGPLVEDWLGCIDDRNSLLDRLCQRAEEVVAGRGQGKQAPHQRRRSDDTDLKRELEVQETSFRLGNGTRILKDIVKALA